MSLSVTSVPVKVSIFNAKTQSEKDHHMHQIIHQLKVKDLLYHSMQRLFLFVVKPTSAKRFEIVKFDVKFRLK